MALITDLTDEFVADSYTGLLHSANTPLGDTLNPYYDGIGNKAPLKMSKTEVALSDIRYPTADPGFPISLMVSNGTSQVSLSSWNQIHQLLGGGDDGVFKNATITITNGIISNISGYNKGLLSYTTPGSHVFTVPSNVYNVKFIITGGGGYSRYYNSGAGGTVIGFLNVNPGENISILVGAPGGVNDTPLTVPGGTTSITDSLGNLIAYADGGNTTTITRGPVGGGIGGIGVSSKLLSHILLPGGHGGQAAISQNDRDSIGAASYWGNAPSYGGGNGGGPGFGPGSSGHGPAGGIAYFEW